MRYPLTDPFLAILLFVSILWRQYVVGLSHSRELRRTIVYSVETCSSYMEHHVQLVILQLSVWCFLYSKDWY